MRLLQILLSIVSLQLTQQVFANNALQLNEGILENYRYLVDYRGIFSMGGTIPIADLMLKTQKLENDDSYLETELKVTSKAYSFVESLYPLRYRFRSWYWDDLSAGIAFEAYQKTKSTKHKLTLLDDPEKDFVTYNISKETQKNLEALHEGDYVADNGLASAGVLTRSVFDRLTLIQRIRSLPLNPGDKVAIPVTNGRDLMEYHVKVEIVDELIIGKKKVPALKLRFDGLEKDDRGKQKHAHRPLFVWLSNDERHTPLKIESRQPVGLFTIKLVAEEVAELVSL